MIANRRDVLTGGAAAVVVASLAPLGSRAAAAQLGPIGLQLFTLREPFAADPIRTLEQVARIGYRQVEFGGGGYEGMDAAMLRRTMDRFGLTAPSLHISYEALRERFNASVTMAKTLGSDTVIVPGMMAAYRNPAAWISAVADFNRIAEKLKKAGLGFAYHNHDFEFAPQPGGVTLFDLLLRDRDPALIRFELDLYWLVKAGQDPRALIRRLPGQVYSYHVKDMSRDGDMAAIGTGTIDFASIFALNKLAGVQRFFVENDRAPTPFFPDITTSFGALRRLRFPTR